MDMDKAACLDDLEKIFGKARIRDFACVDDGFDVDVSGVSVTFDALERVSLCFNTKTIDIGGDRDGSKCDTCDFGVQKWVKIEVRGLGLRGGRR